MSRYRTVQQLDSTSPDNNNTSTASTNTVKKAREFTSERREQMFGGKQNHSVETHNKQGTSSTPFTAPEIATTPTTHNPSPVESMQQQHKKVARTMSQSSDQKTEKRRTSRFPKRIAASSPSRNRNERQRQQDDATDSNVYSSWSLSTTESTEAMMQTFVEVSELEKAMSASVISVGSRQDVNVQAERSSNQAPTAATAAKATMNRGSETDVVLQQAADDQSSCMSHDSRQGNKDPSSNEKVYEGPFDDKETEEIIRKYNLILQRRMEMLKKSQEESHSHKQGDGGPGGAGDDENCYISDDDDESEGRVNNKNQGNIQPGSGVGTNTCDVVSQDTSVFATGLPDSTSLSSDGQAWLTTFDSAVESCGDGNMPTNRTVHFQEGYDQGEKSLGKRNTTTSESRRSHYDHKSAILAETYRQANQHRPEQHSPVTSDTTKMASNRRQPQHDDSGPHDETYAEDNQAYIPPELSTKHLLVQQQARRQSRQITNVSAGSPKRQSRSNSTANTASFFANDVEQQENLKPSGDRRKSERHVRVAESPFERKDSIVRSTATSVPPKSREYQGPPFEQRLAGLMQHAEKINLINQSEPFFVKQGADNVSYYSPPPEERVQTEKIKQQKPLHRIQQLVSPPPPPPPNFQRFEAETSPKAHHVVNRLGVNEPPPPPPTTPKTPAGPQPSVFNDGFPSESRKTKSGKTPRLAKYVEASPGIQEMPNPSSINNSGRTSPWEAFGTPFLRSVSASRTHEVFGDASPRNVFPDEAAVSFMSANETLEFNHHHGVNEEEICPIESDESLLDAIPAPPSSATTTVLSRGEQQRKERNLFQRSLLEATSGRASKVRHNYTERVSIARDMLAASKPTVASPLQESNLSSFSNQSSRTTRTSSSPISIITKHSFAPKTTSSSRARANMRSNNKAQDQVADNFQFTSSSLSSFLTDDTLTATMTTSTTNDDSHHPHHHPTISMGATWQDILQFPSRTLTRQDIVAYQKRSRDIKYCYVCTKTFRDGDVVRTLPCDHTFHTTCVDQHLFQQAQCPMCKTSTSVLVEI